VLIATHFHMLQSMQRALTAMKCDFGRNAPCERNARDFVIDAALLAEALGLTQDGIKARMQNGAITWRRGTGVDDDSGNWRLNLNHADRACRFIVDAACIVLKRTSFPISPRSGATAPSGSEPTK
jgi:hypothetical protein